MTDISKEAVEMFYPPEIEDACEILDREAQSLGWQRHIYSDKLRALSARIEELEAQVAAARNEALREAAEVARVRVKICEQEEKRDADSIGASCRLEADLIRRRILALMEEPTNG